MPQPPWILARWEGAITRRSGETAVVLLARDEAEVRALEAASGDYFTIARCTPPAAAEPTVAPLPEPRDNGAHTTRKTDAA